MTLAFVRRERELAALEQHLEAALAGQPRFCFVIGEAGSGKSSLIRAFSAKIQERHPTLVVVVGDCNAQTGQSDPYLPFLSLLTQLTGSVEAQVAQGTTTSASAERLRSLTRFSMKALVDFAPDLIGTLVPGASLVTNAAKYLANESGLLNKLNQRLEQTKVPGSAGELNQERIVQQYTDLLVNLAAQCPLVLIVDDMQWIDSSSVDLLFHLSRKLDHSRILLIGCYRPHDVGLGRGGERHPLVSALNEMKRYLGDVWINLDQGVKDGGRAFVDAYLDTEPNRLDDDFRAALFRHTQGRPLFVVELLRHLQERGDLVRDAEGRWVVGSRLNWSVLPSRMEGVIEERIGRLEEDLREILAVASVEGESFTAQIVARIQQMRERDLLRLLSRQLEKRHHLIQEGNTERVGSSWLSQFAFSQALFQQYLYRDLGRRERMLLHEEVAGLTEEIYAGQTEVVALQLARHYEVAGVPEKAARYKIEAAKRALRVSAYVEARSLFDQALDLLHRLPAGAERDRLELEIRNCRSNILNAQEGWDSPALIEEYYRSRELCRALEERQQLSRVLFGLWTYHLVKIELDRAYSFVQEYFALAEDLQDSEVLLLAHTGMSNVLFWMGRLTESLEHARRALALFDPASQADHALRYGQDPRLFPLMFVNYCCWILGDADGAREAEREALRIAQELAHPFSQTIAFQIAGYFGHGLRDPATALEYAEREVHFAETYHFPFYLGLALTLRGWARALLGEEEGVEEIRKGFAMWTGFGGRINHSVYCLMLAEAQAHAGQIGDALATVEQGLEVALACKELCYEAELYRWKGELLLARHEGDPEPLFSRALDTARNQNAKLFELRAAVSLARFWSRRGRADEACELLAPLCAAFTSGHETVDLQEAHALLQASTHLERAAS